MKTLLFFLLFLCGTTFASGENYYLSICALFRNEARFLREWIEYHHMLGVDHFYLFNNLSEDNYLEVLKPYLDSGLVELYDWPIDTQEASAFGHYVQMPAYQQILRQKCDETFWLAFIDTDEFIVPKLHHSIPAFLKKFEKYGGVVLNWQLFGTSNISYVPEDKLMIEMLTKKSPEKDEKNKNIKSIVRPKRISYMAGPHFACYLRSFYGVAENEKKIAMAQTTKKVRVKKIQLNHYFARDKTFFEKEKTPRLKKWYPDMVPKVDGKYNSVTDTSILRFIPELKRRMSLND